MSLHCSCCILFIVCICLPLLLMHCRSVWAVNIMCTAEEISWAFFINHQLRYTLLLWVFAFAELWYHISSRPVGDTALTLACFSFYQLDAHRRWQQSLSHIRTRDHNSGTLCHQTAELIIRRLLTQQHSVYRRQCPPVVSASDLLVATNSTFHEPARSRKNSVSLSTVQLYGTVFQSTCAHQTSQRTCSERS